MGDIMRPIPFSELVNRMFSELRSQDSIFGIEREQFFEDKENQSITVFGQKCSTPCGPAAGPHTQLAQNIITSYLVGGRFIELKTVQVMDDLVISKPCIDARDEGYNVEWSTEYTLPKAFDEYLKAWIIIHLIQCLQRKGKVAENNFIFNMSVGYNLDGIITTKMQTFINSMMDASVDPKFELYLDQLRTMLDAELLEGTPFEGLEQKAKAALDSICPKICTQVTISTMHGCPPKEIESICTYMLKEKKLNTFVKLNPTLLGYDAVREILDKTGFKYVTLTRENFEHDLQYSDAILMLHRLVDLAKKLKLGFGVKLTNTLGSVNDQGQLPGNEMYMSGRALLPISTRVAAKLSKEFGGKLPISYSGGANAFTILDLFETGIRPITLATDMLHPGGYTRMTNMVEILLKQSKTWNKEDISVEAVEALADKSLEAKYQSKLFRGTTKAKTAEKLDMFDCYVAPCQVACPIHQNIPDYVMLVGEGRYKDALELIYEDNALPNITCNICNHKCQDACSRMDYEGAVQIRNMKKAAVEKGGEEYYKNFEDPDPAAEVKAVVVGAGPAGLSAAYFLARAGFDTTILEKEQNAGGVVRNIIPEFRIPQEAIEADIAHVERQGVKFVYGVKDEDVKASVLKAKGYDYIFYAIGCEKENLIDVPGKSVVGALDFLKMFRAKPEEVNLGKHVIVCGAGNTAMDSARAALRVKGVETVTIVYRRAEDQMPAKRDEYEMALDDGVKFLFLANPKSYKDGILTCSVMALGEPDASGRRRPIETGKTTDIECDYLIAAFGEHLDEEAVAKLEIPCENCNHIYKIGDMNTGASVVVNCIASAREAVEDAIDQVLGQMEDDDCCCEEEHECHCGHHHDEDHECHCNHDHDEDHECCCGHDHDDCCCEEEEELSEEENQELIEAEQKFFSQIMKKKSSFRCSKNYGDKDFEQNEALRCNDCSYLCNKCTEVCPNRANVAIDVRGYEEFEDPFQIVHIDAYCNECGNCANFCNHMGRPYKDKFTIFSRRDDFEDSLNSGFLLEGEKVLIRFDGKVCEYEIDSEGLVSGDIDERVKALIQIIVEDYNYLLGAVEE